MSAGAEPLLAVDDLTIRFGGIVALDHVSFDVPDCDATLTDRLGDTGVLTRGRSTTLSGRLTNSHGTGVVGRPVHLWKRLVGTTKWYVVATTVIVDTTGAWHLSVQPTKSAVFQVKFHGGAWHTAATSPRHRA